MKKVTSLYLSENVIRRMKSNHIENVSDLVDSFLRLWLDNLEKDKMNVTESTLKDLTQYTTLCKKCEHRKLSLAVKELIKDDRKM